MQGISEGVKLIGSNPAPGNIPECDARSLSCDLCRGIGFLLIDGRALICDCKLLARALAKVPKRFLAARLEDFPSSAEQAARAWIESMGDGLLISGAVGTGKTWLACASLVAIALTHRTSLFVRCAEFYLQVRSAFNAGSSEEQILEKLSCCGVLFLDDLGATACSDFERRMTLELVDRRLNALRPTVVTTNQSLDEIARRLDDRLASRLALFTQLELTGIDRRLLGGRSGV